MYVIQFLRAKEHNVVVSGLSKDFRGQAFGPIPSIMAISDTNVLTVVSVCAIPGCRNDGTMNQRLRDNVPDDVFSKQ